MILSFSSRRTSINVFCRNRTGFISTGFPTTLANIKNEVDLFMETIFGDVEELKIFSYLDFYQLKNRINSKSDVTGTEENCPVLRSMESEEEDSEVMPKVSSAGKKVNKSVKTDLSIYYGSQLDAKVVKEF